MAKYEYNWATAEMAKQYLRNSRSQANRKARTAAKTATASSDTSTNPALMAAGGTTGLGDDLDSDSDDSDDLDEE